MFKGPGVRVVAGEKGGRKKDSARKVVAGKWLSLQTWLPCRGREGMLSITPGT